MGWFSALMERRALRAWAIIAVVGAMAAVLLIGMQSAFASHPEVSLPGSDFEIDTDANLKVDDAAPSIDWASVPQGGSAIGSEVRQSDKPTGQTDDSFGQGTKEDTAVPTVIDGSIPNNKSDLVTFGVTLEENASGRFMHMYWHRVQEPTGTTNMDFEFNQSSTNSGNGVTPVRTAGDLLIQYDLAQGGTNPQLFLSEWVTIGNKSLCEAANSTPCWGDRINLTAAGDATGSINTSSIPAAESDGLGDISPRTFGEATVDFDALAGDDPCVGFGSAYLKSRASDSFTAALKDFIAPTALNIDQCGALEITKTRKHAAGGSGAQPHAGVEFTVTGGDLPAAGTKVTTNAQGKACLSGLTLATYTVTETVPSGYVSDAANNTPANSKTATVNAVGTCTSGAATVSFSNTPLTDIEVTATSQVDGGTASQINCVNEADEDVGNSGPDFVDPATANANDLPPGTYTCTVVVDP
jgi:hypothetical protein